ncbi:MAG TPA: hypothetical protein VGR97_09865, partial [Candidatus Acidoferrales bacterium]|nr:hypothetical protein [Candidatus Acidoferrales bacterium]
PNSPRRLRPPTRVLTSLVWRSTSIPRVIILTVEGELYNESPAQDAPDSLLKSESRSQSA